jgi:hypothetical protein
MIWTNDTNFLNYFKIHHWTEWFQISFRISLIDLIISEIFAGKDTKSLKFKDVKFYSDIVIDRFHHSMTKLNQSKEISVISARKLFPFDSKINIKSMTKISHDFYRKILSSTGVFLKDRNFTINENN